MISLGVIPLWVLCYVWLSCLFVFYECVRILVEEYRERKKRRGKYQQCPGEPDDASSLFVGGFTQDSKDTRELMKRPHRSARIYGRITTTPDDKLPHLGHKLIPAFVKILHTRIIHCSPQAP